MMDDLVTGTIATARSHFVSFWFLCGEWYVVNQLGTDQS